MKKYIKDMTTNELIKLIDNNQQLKEVLREDARQNADFWASEYLNNASSSFCDYSFNGYREPNYFAFSKEVYDINAIIEYCNSLDRTFEFFYKCNEFKRFKEIANTFANKYCSLGSTNYERLESRYLELLESVEDFIYEQITNEYDYPEKADSSELLDFWDALEVNEVYLDDAYIINDNYGEILADIPERVIPSQTIKVF